MSAEISPSAAAQPAAAAAQPAAASRRAMPARRSRYSKVASPVFVGTLIAVGILIRFLVDRLDRENYAQRAALWDSKFTPTMRTTVIERGAQMGNRSCIVEIHQLPELKSGFYSGRAGSLPMMYHAWQMKHVSVTAGLLGFARNDTLGEAKAGERVSFAPGVPHTLWNADNTTTLTYEITLQPCPGSERLYENVAALAEMAGSLERINPLQLLVTMHHFHVRITELPPWLNRVVDAMLVPLGHVLGLKPVYPQYVSLTRAQGLALDTARQQQQQQSAAAQQQSAGSGAGSGAGEESGDAVSEVPPAAAADHTEL